MLMPPLRVAEGGGGAVTEVDETMDAAKDLPVAEATKPGGTVDSSGAIAGGGPGRGGGGGSRSGPTACQSVGSGRVRGGGM